MKTRKKDSKVGSLVLYCEDGVPISWRYYRRVGAKVIERKIAKYGDITTTEARRIAERMNVEFGNTETETLSVPTLREVFDRWKQTDGKYRKSIDRLERMMTGKLLGYSMLSLDMITQQEVNELKENNSTTPVMFNRCRALISRLFNFASAHIKSCYSIPNPCRAVEPYPEQARAVTIPASKIGELWNYLDSHRDNDFADLVKTMLLLGKRPSNIYSLRWSEIDFGNGMLHISGDETKNGKGIDCPIPDDVLSILERRRNNDSQWVFPSHLDKTKHVVDIRKKLKEMSDAIGLGELHPHDLRRTHGTLMLNAGASIEQVSRSLDHSSISVTERVYARLGYGKIKESQRLLERLIHNNVKKETKWKKKT